MGKEQSTEGPGSRPPSPDLAGLLELMARLRHPEHGCPWDRQQSFASIAPYTIEEAYEVADAIERNDPEELRAELGDLLFQVVFHAQMASEAGLFDFAAVVSAIVGKMIRRHPHVFGELKLASAEEQSTAWELHKAGERATRSGGEPGSVLDGVAAALPALSRAAKLQRRAARVGFDWSQIEGVIAKVQEELGELRAELQQERAPERLMDEVGDLLFSCVNLARHTGVDPEKALRAANLRFERRFRAMETAVAAQGRSCAEASLEEMNEIWERVKRQGL